MTKDVLKRAKNVRLLVMDVDGVLTDGQLYYLPSPDGSAQEVKAFNSQDGIALWMLPDLGLQSGIISGRESSGVTARAKLINIKYVVQNTKIKLPAFQQMCKDAGVTADQAAFMGDDMTDIPVMHRCGLALAPANARPEAKKAAHYVTKVGGGHGAVREAVEFILNAQGKWKDVVKRFS